MRSAAAALRAHLESPLLRNGYALVLSSGITSVFGLAFWLVAARVYSPATVGVNSALISATMLVAVFAQLNLSSALNRFVPSAGSRAGRLIGASYAISALVGLAAAAVFVLGAPVWSPALGFLRSDLPLALWFAVATALWCVFVLQDGTLTGLRHAGWVPVENTAYAVTKIAVLVALAGPLASYGLFLAWTLPLIPIVVVVNAGVFRRLLPRHGRRANGRPASPGEISRFVAADYTVSLVSTGVGNLLPLLALGLAGAAASAYFYLPWTIAYSLYLVSRNMGMSLVAESAHDEAGLAEYSRQVAVQAARLLVPAVAIVVAVAPLLLGLFGAGYAREGATLLRLLAVAALPTVVTSLYTSILRVQRRMRRLVVTTAVLYGTVLPCSYLLLRSHGIVGIGMAWLGVHTVAAVLLVATELRPLWAWRVSPAALRRLGAVRQRLRSKQRAELAAGLLADIAPTLTSAGVATAADRWQPKAVLSTVGDVAVATIGPASGPAEAILKIASTRRGSAALRRHAQVLGELSTDARLAGWATVLPDVLGVGSTDGKLWVAERLLPGTDGRAVLGDPGARSRLLAAAAATIGELHARTAVPRRVDTAVLTQWVDEPARVLRAWAEDAGARAEARALEQMAEELRGALHGATLLLGRGHGDLAPGNLLVARGAARVSGVVDWEKGSPAVPGELDLCHLALSTQMLVQRRELGDVVCDVVAAGAGDWRHGLPAGSVLDTSPLGQRQTVLLTWLLHVAGILAKSDRYADHRWWLSRNVRQVLVRAVADPAAGAGAPLAGLRMAGS